MVKMLSVKENFNYFLIDTKGYKKQWSSQVQARRSFSIIERDAKERGDPVSIKLFGKVNVKDEWTLLDHVEIEEAYYQ